MPKPNNQTPPEPKGVKKIGIKKQAASIKNETETEETIMVDETEKFDRYVKSEIRDNEIEEGLNEIYQDDDGRIVDVQKMEIRKSHGIIFRIFSTLLTILIIGGLAWVGYYYYNLKKAGESNAVKLTIETEKEVDAGKEFQYTIDYKNFENVDLKNLTIRIKYPENFVFLESSPLPAEENNTWKLEQLETKRSGQIIIKGKLIGETGSNAITFASMNYTPKNFSSELTKEASFEQKISGIGLEASFDAQTNVLVGDENEIIVKYKYKPENYLNGFRVTVVPQDNIVFSKRETASATPGVWEIASTTETATSTEQEKEIKIKFKFADKISDEQKVLLNFETTHDGQKYFSFLKKELPYTVMKRELNLNLIMNGSKNDQAVDFGQTLNYSISYSNKGKAEMKDIIIMAILESDFLDWTSLSDKNNGKVKDNKITWSKAEIPSLASLGSNAEGVIDFSIKVGGISEADPTKNYQIKSYARFSVGVASSTDATSTEPVETKEPEQDNKSNIITSKLNSDLNLKEEVRYFNDDNIAVGSGPQPPKIGETTSYKVYWRLTNTLNELNSLKIESTLPAHVNWDSKNQASIGAIQYDNATRKVIWDIGRLPITVNNAEAEFNISITPSANDKNKMVVLLSGTSINGMDNATQSKISKSLNAKTSKLDDDPAMTDDGRVQ